MRLKNVLIAVAGMAAGAALTLAAASATTPTATADEHDNAMNMAQRAQVMAVTFQLDKSGFHDADVALAAGTMPAGALGNIRRARIATMATAWPEAMKDQAIDLVGHMMELEKALLAEDVATAAPHAKKVHDVAHDLSAAVYTMLTAQAGQLQPAHSH